MLSSFSSGMKSSSLDTILQTVDRRSSNVASSRSDTLGHFVRATEDATTSRAVLSIRPSNRNASNNELDRIDWRA
jgi:hypothetical protein